MEDLVNAMNKCDNDGISFPTFVSSDLSKIPQNNDGSIALNQLMYLIIEMKTQITNLEKKCAASPPTPPDPDPTPTISAEKPSIVTNPSPPSMAQTVSASLAQSASCLTNSASAVPSVFVTPKALSDALDTALPKTKENFNEQNPSNLKAKKNDKRLNPTAKSRIKSNFSRNRNLVIGKKPSS